LKREVTIFRLLKERVGSHPHIVGVQDVYFDEPPFYLIMDYAEGVAAAGRGVSPRQSPTAHAQPRMKQDNFMLHMQHEVGRRIFPLRSWGMPPFISSHI
jgi:hypothetical protein